MPAPTYSRNQILNQNTSDFPNNNGGLITPAVMRDYNANVANSVLFLDETGSEALHSLTSDVASLAITASYALNFNPAATASYAITASYALNGGGGGGSVNTGSLLTTASAVDNTLTFTKGDGTTFNVTVNTGSNAISASYATSATSATTATTATTSTSASYASNAELLDNLNSTAFAQLSQNNTFTGKTTLSEVTASNVYVMTASIDYLTVVYQTSSIVVTTGSNVFGDAANDSQTLWGTVLVKTGPLIITGSATSTAGFTGSLSGTATSASRAITAATASVLGTYPASAYARLAAQNTFTQDQQVIIGDNSVGTFQASNLFLLNSVDTSEIGVSNDLTGLGASGDAGIYVNDNLGAYLTAIEIPNGPSYNNLISLKFPTQITGSLTVSGNINGTLIGNASTATTASYASTASYYGGSVVSSSYALSSSYAVSSSRAVTSATASVLGTYPASAYARLAASNNFTQDQLIAVGDYQAGTYLGANWYILNAITAAEVGLSNDLAGLGAAGTAGIYVNDGSSVYHTAIEIPNGPSYTGTIGLKLPTVITGSLRGQVSALSISSNTASLDCSLNNFFTLQLVSGSDIYINPSNINAGQTINLKLSTTGSGTVSFPSSVKQISGSSYVPTTTTGTDIVTFVAFDASSLYLANVKNLI